MNFAVIGLGSMGTRRIRCLDQLGYDDVIGFDIDEEKREAAATEYEIETVSEFEALDIADIDILVISTPPFAHNEYIESAIKHATPAFVEASVVKEGLPELAVKAKEHDVRIAPSCTMRFHPAIKDIKSIVESKDYGTITTFTYYMGQYLPDWHPWQDVREFYVSRSDTSATREMVPFELTWLTEVAGHPARVDSFQEKTADVGADIDDAYAISLDMDGSVGTMLIDVVGRYASRELILNLERAQIRWSWDDDVVEVYDAERERWIEYHQPAGETQKGYNQNIIENMYVEELQAFIQEIDGGETYPHTLEEDIRILELLERIES